MKFITITFYCQFKKCNFWGSKINTPVRTCATGGQPVTGFNLDFELYLEEHIECLCARTFIKQKCNKSQLSNWLFISASNKIQKAISRVRMQIVKMRENEVCVVAATVSAQTVR